MRDIKKIIIHNSESEWGTERIIRNWHVEGNGWDDTGYHYIILNGILRPNEKSSFFDGVVTPARPLPTAGAHVKGHNADSIGICLIGKETFTDKQQNELWRLLEYLCATFQLNINMDVFGHHDFTEHKTCPNFDVRDWIKLRQDKDFAGGDSWNPRKDKEAAGGETIEKPDYTLDFLRTDIRDCIHKINDLTKKVWSMDYELKAARSKIHTLEVTDLGLPGAIKRIIDLENGH